MIPILRNITADPANCNVIFVWYLQWCGKVIGRPIINDNYPRCNLQNIPCCVLEIQQIYHVRTNNKKNKPHQNYFSQQEKYTAFVWFILMLLILCSKQKPGCQEYFFYSLLTDAIATSMKILIIQDIEEKGTAEDRTWGKCKSSKRNTTYDIRRKRTTSAYNI